MKIFRRNYLWAICISSLPAFALASESDETEKNKIEFSRFILEVDLPDMATPTYAKSQPFIIKLMGKRPTKDAPPISTSFTEDKSVIFPALFNENKKRILFGGKAPANFSYNSIALYAPPYDKPSHQWHLPKNFTVEPFSFYNFGTITVRRQGLFPKIDWSETIQTDLLAKNFTKQSSDSSVLNEKKSSNSNNDTKNKNQKESFYNELTYTFEQPAEKDGVIIVPNAGGAVLKRDKSGNWSAHRFQIEEPFISASFIPSSNRIILATTSKIYLADTEKNQLKELSLPSDKFIRMAQNCDQKNCYLALQEKATITVFSVRDPEKEKWELVGIAAEYKDKAPFLSGTIHLGKEIKIPMNLSYKNEIILFGKKGAGDKIQWESSTIDHHAFFDDKQSAIATQNNDFNFFYIETSLLSKKIMTNKSWNEPAEGSPINYDLWSVYADGSGFGIHQSYDENIYFREKQDQEWKNAGVGKFKVGRFYRDVGGNVYAFGGDGQVADLGKGDRWKDIQIESNNKKN